MGVYVRADKSHYTIGRLLSPRDLPLNTRQQGSVDAAVSWQRHPPSPCHLQHSKLFQQSLQERTMRTMVQIVHKLPPESSIQPLLNSALAKG